MQKEEELRETKQEQNEMQREEARTREKKQAQIGMQREEQEQIEMQREEQEMGWDTVRDRAGPDRVGESYQVAKEGELAEKHHPSGQTPFCPPPTAQEPTATNAVLYMLNIILFLKGLCHEIFLLNHRCPGPWLSFRVIFSLSKLREDIRHSMCPSGVHDTYGEWKMIDQKVFHIVLRDYWVAVHSYRLISLIYCMFNCSF